MLQQARTKRLHWWLMESRLDQNGRQIQKARSEITCAWHFKYVVVVVEWWTLSCIEIRSLSSPPNPFSLNPSIWEEVEEKYQNQARAFFTIIFSTILHGSSPPTYKCRFILTRHNAFNSDKLSSVTVDGSFTAIYSRRSVGRGDMMAGPLKVCSYSVHIHKNETILNSVCPSNLPQSATTFGTSILWLPSQWHSRSPRRSSRDQMRWDQVTCL